MRDYDRLSSELIRALRGRRSQAVLSRRLGYTTNAVYTWESGRAFPSAARLLELAAHVGRDVASGLARFLKSAPGDLGAAALRTPQGITRILVTMKGGTPVTTLARTSGLSRYVLSRWLHGKAQPRVPELLCYVEHSSLRLLDFLELFVDPAHLPSVSGEWRRLQTARSVGYDLPFTHAVLRALELEGYRAGSAHDPRRLAAALGAPVEAVERCLEKLAESGQIRKRRGLWEPHAAHLVDFRREPEAAARLRAYWAGLAAERVATGSSGLTAYNVFAVSRADLARLQALQRDLLREMRTLIGESEPSQVVALINVQILPLGTNAED